MRNAVGSRKNEVRGCRDRDGASKVKPQAETRCAMIDEGFGASDRGGGGAGRAALRRMGPDLSIDNILT